MPSFMVVAPPHLSEDNKGNIEKVRQPRSSGSQDSPYHLYASSSLPRAVLLDGLPASARTCFLNIPSDDDEVWNLFNGCSNIRVSEYSTVP